MTRTKIWEHPDHPPKDLSLGVEEERVSEASLEEMFEELLDRPGDVA